MSKICIKIGMDLFEFDKELFIGNNIEEIMEVFEDEFTDEQVLQAYKSSRYDTNFLFDYFDIDLNPEHFLYNIWKHFTAEITYKVNAIDEYRFTIKEALKHK